MEIHRSGIWACAVAFVVAVAGCSQGPQRGDERGSGSESIARVAEPLTSPDSECTHRTFGGGEYWFCDNHRNWADARSRCQARGMDLVRVDGAAENDFVRANIDGDWWIGANDQTTEGAWVWTIGGNQFWSGASSGSAVGGLFSGWDRGQPNDLGDEDCARMRPDGKWFDDSCADAEEYICEFAVDQCPGDPNKSAPGDCGCGAPDTDSDSDGTADCNDECPNDPDKIIPGDCGCSDAPKPAGTACDDGICSANTQCDGAGRCGSATACAPDTGCILKTFASTPYWFCDADQTFATAQQKCQAVGMDLANIETAGEDDFITGIIDKTIWIGSTDAQSPGNWSWLGTGRPFWTGGTGGGPVGGAYTNWEHDDPDFGIHGDCAAKDSPVGGGKWENFSCTGHRAYVCERVLHVHPTLNCVRRYKSPAGAALFGYDNASDVAVVIPHGSLNQLTPTSSVEPPQNFEPGIHDHEFWVPFDLTGTMTWDLAGEQIVANGSSAPCQLADVPPGDEPEPQPPVALVDRPTVPFSAVADRIIPDVTTSAFTSLPNRIFGPERGPEAGNTSNEEAGPAPFTFNVDSLTFNDSEGLCGTVDPFVNNLVIDGQGFGSTNSGTVDVARDRRTVHVSVDVDDDDAFLCLGDDDLRQYELDVDLYTGATTDGETCVDGGRMCFTASAIASPDVCFNFNAQFLDAAPWTGIGPEDFLQGDSIQKVPAAFARYELRLENSTGILYDRGGTLNAKGCVPGPKLPIRAHFQLGGNLRITARLISQHCLDAAGTDCPMSGSNFTGANVVVRETGTTGPAVQCATLAEDPSAVTDPACEPRQISWTNFPPSPVLLDYRDENGVTRTSAVISHLLAREANTNGGLGIATAVAQRRVEGNGLVEIAVDEFCDTSDPCTGEALRTTCRNGNVLELEPDDLIPSTTRFKNVIAHEFGHFIQGNGQGLMAQNYGCGPGDPNTPALCRCDHVPHDEQLHCMQSLEEPNAAQMEGFGYFYSAKAFNQDLEADCTFAYAKPIANTTCMPGAASCAPGSGGFMVSQPPVPLNCRQAVRWRNNNCIDSNSSPDLLSHGVEWDWVEFFYAVNNLPAAAERWSVTDIFNAYAAACGGSTNPPVLTSCSGQSVSWAGGNGYFSLAGGVQALATGGFKTQAAALRLILSGDDFGVNDVP